MYDAHGVELEAQGTLAYGELCGVSPVQAVHTVSPHHPALLLAVLPAQVLQAFDSANYICRCMFSLTAKVV